jgi:uncharacterized protein (TIGR02246 family)
MPRHSCAFRCVIAAIVTNAIFSSCERSASSSAENDKEMIAAISAERAKAFREGNAAGIAVHFADSCVLMVPGKPVSKGTRAVEEYYRSIFNEYLTDLESRYEELEVSGNLAYGRGEAKVTLIPRNGGDTLISTAKYLNILKKQADGVWKTTHDIWNGNEGE